ncbi:GAF and ANTAR domain-containing protein [Streptomonospora halophila]|uniref:GAF and ANTAR domain-containing protein n=1 Tax=Streptomonospora halophila TaxID=427369 RepID=A0ABP9GMC8_9ACTN
MSTPPQPERDLATELAALARALQERRDVADVRADIVAAAVRLVPGADHAALSLQERTGLRSAAATGESARRTDTLQYWCRQGPSVQAVDDAAAVRADLHRETRWPEFTPRALDRGVGSVLALPLTQKGAQGALLLFSPAVSAFTADDERIAGLVAAHAGAALAAAHERAHLRAALESREVIGQATGVLMERNRLPAEDAFAALSRASQNTNRKLREVAEHLVRARAADPAAPGRRGGNRSADPAAPPV